MHQGRRPPSSSPNLAQRPGRTAFANWRLTSDRPGVDRDGPCPHGAVANSRRSGTNAQHPAERCAPGGTHRRQGTRNRFPAFWPLTAAGTRAHRRESVPLSLRSPLTPSRPPLGTACIRATDHPLPGIGQLIQYWQLDCPRGTQRSNTSRWRSQGANCSSSTSRMATANDCGDGRLDVGWLGRPAPAVEIDEHHRARPRSSLVPPACDSSMRTDSLVVAIGSSTQCSLSRAGLSALCGCRRHRQSERYRVAVDGHRATSWKVRRARRFGDTGFDSSGGIIGPRGLGLPLARQLIESMPGRLTITRGAPHPPIDIVFPRADSPRR